MYLSINPPPSINRPPSHGFSSHGFSTSQRLPATPLAPHPGRANFQGPAAAVALEPRRPGGPRRPCLGTDGTEHGCRAMSCVVDDLCISMLYTHNMHIYIYIYVTGNIRCVDICICIYIYSKSYWEYWLYKYDIWTIPGDSPPMFIADWQNHPKKDVALRGLIVREYINHHKPENSWQKQLQV